MSVTEQRPETNYRHRAEYWENEARKALADAQRANGAGKLAAGIEYGNMATAAELRARSERRQWVLSVLNKANDRLRFLSCDEEGGDGTAMPEDLALSKELEDVIEYVHTKI